MARSGDLVAIPHALASQRIGLRAILEPVELNLGSLAQLQPGDIVPLSHPLDADVVLADDEGTRLLAGFLGRAGSRRALQLTPGAGASRPIAP
jgi:flagellar motor switch protein FliM